MIRFIVFIELIVLVVVMVMFFYPSLYIVGVWLFEKNSPTSLRETFQGAQRFMQFKKKY